ncbi:unnamed protein product [Acanthoscelides obtectus]|uniref:Uncharacterized protein n=1 Tax=Acanthoscelides obtectus TaxID=200917 RepID=A0A9P0P7B1_ACAOB|nr:unnamed protein product [Acanthoscelides obtectus]CAK1677897.1 hypothetical protein AOBTE_LOCUS31628 [Acanthoscelides obtectus]
MTMHHKLLGISPNYILLFLESAPNHTLVLIPRLLRLLVYRRTNTQSEDEIEPEEEDDSTDEDEKKILKKI